MRGDPPKMKFIYKKLCIYSHVFKLQSPSKYSPFDATQLQKCFLHCSKQFLNLLILMPFSASAIFLFHFFHMSKAFPFEDFFSSGEAKKKLLRARLGE